MQPAELKIFVLWPGKEKFAKPFENDEVSQGLSLPVCVMSTFQYILNDPYYADNSGILSYFLHF